MAEPATVADQAERALIGALLIDRDAIASVVERIQPAAFAHPGHRATYAAIIDCWQRRVPPDLLTVSAAIVQAGGTEPSLADLVDMELECPWACHAPYYADLVVEQAQARAVEELGAKLMIAARSEPGLDPAATMAAALADLPQFGAVAAAGPRSYAELVPDFQERIIRQWDGAEPRMETPSGFRLLDHTLRGGFRPGELTLLAARPSIGKTALALQLAHNASRSGKRVLIFSAEMSTESLLYRAAAEISGVPPRMIDERTARPTAYDAFLQSTELMRRLPISVDDTSGITVDQMLVRIQRAQAHAPVDLVVFDYIELAGDQVKGDSEERRVGTISRKLKHVARTCNVPVLALCQLSRQVEHRSEHKPRLADLRYSGSLEADADVVLFLYREAYYVTQGHIKTATVAADLAEVIVAKHRNGPTGKVALRFHDETMRFTDLDH